MKLSEEELDSWFIELPLDFKKYLFFNIKLHHLDYDKVDYCPPQLEWNNLFKCESNTPETLADKKELSELYNMAVNKYK